jgi:hypothetical protein
MTNPKGEVNCVCEKQGVVKENREPKMHQICDADATK